MEITSAVSPREFLQREALATKELVYLGPSVRRVGSRAKGTAGVESHLEVRHSAAARHDLTTWIIQAVQEKLKKQYPSPSILLVRVEAEAILKPGEWHELAISTERSLAGPYSFDAVYVVQTSAGHILRVR